MHSIHNPRACARVGCGFGSTALAAAERGAEVHGVDISPPMIQRARERAPKRPRTPRSKSAPRKRFARRALRRRNKPLRRHVLRRPRARLSQLRRGHASPRAIGIRVLAGARTQSVDDRRTQGAAKLDGRSTAATATRVRPIRIRRIRVRRACPRRFRWTQRSIAPFETRTRMGGQRWRARRSEQALSNSAPERCWRWAMRRYAIAQHCDSHRSVRVVERRRCRHLSRGARGWSPHASPSDATRCHRTVTARSRGGDTPVTRAT